MIIQELASYYDSLAELGKVGIEGWGKAKVSYGLRIDEEGDLIGVVPLFEISEGGKRKFQKPCLFRNK